MEHGSQWWRYKKADSSILDGPKKGSKKQSKELVKREKQLWKSFMNSASNSGTDYSGHCQKSRDCLVVSGSILFFVLFPSVLLSFVRFIRRVFSQSREWMSVLCVVSFDQTFGCCWERKLLLFWSLKCVCVCKRERPKQSRRLLKPSYFTVRTGRETGDSKEIGKRQKMGGKSGEKERETSAIWE